MRMFQQAPVSATAYPPPSAAPAAAPAAAAAAPATTQRYGLFF